MVRRQFSRGAQRSCIRVVFGCAVAGLVALPTIAAAQSGKGFLFKKPSGSFVMRAGYEAAVTSSQPFTVRRQETTLGPRSCDASPPCTLRSPSSSGGSARSRRSGARA